jgi:hypothetical protein
VAIANNPRLILDVPSLARLIFSTLMFGACFTLWFYGRDRLSRATWGVRTARYAAAAGALMAVVG